MLIFHYLGKLRKTREFLISNSLNMEDRNFWDNWFNRCGNGNQLMPFLKPKVANDIIWLFLIKHQNKFYVGLGSQSQDLTGRSYPFLIFNQLDLNNNFTKNFYQSLKHYIGFMDEFEKLLNQGYIEFDTKIGFDGLSQMQSIVTDEFTNEVGSTLLTNIEQELYASNWYDIKTSKYIIHPNALTCNLYTKVFG